MTSHQQAKELTGDLMSVEEAAEYLACKPRMIRRLVYEARIDSVVARLKDAGLRVFYDSDYRAETWGEDLIEYFDSIYRRQARYAMLFVSRFYAAKDWTRHERRSALARGLRSGSAYILPIRLDDTVLEGLRDTVGYLDARQIGLDGVVGVALAKLRGKGAATVCSITRVPRTEIERQEVLLQRLVGWEYLYLVGQLLYERERSEGKYRDHEMRYASRSGQSISRESMLSYLLDAKSDLVYLINNLNVVMEQSVQERAVGARGQAGDPERLLHLARRWNTIYEELMDWAARVRSARAPSEYEKSLRAPRPVRGRPG